ncbi:NAD(P)-binding protein [Amniculicola lignicola CBS 123094]|uniref:NAD(P)-binding protein n=1 Tax=Amniculicola lignicola CBS 123094 TaxID=1392246 RepID=A0A6A5X2A2_9PLEO|nr:NAD(P)-binding protein [Amniculicola lignicola CBS 123094]
MSAPLVVVAGTTGGLAKLIVQDLIKRGAKVKAIIRPQTDPARIEILRSLGVEIASVGLPDLPGLTNELTGATCVVSALQGLTDIKPVAQGNLLDAAVAANVSRFIPSDFSPDFTKAKAGSNGNLDLRRDLRSRLDNSGISLTSIFIGGFMDLLGGDSPILNNKSRKVSYIEQTITLLDFTSMVDTAACTAAVASDPNPAPEFLRIAGKVEGTIYKPYWMGPIGFMIRALQLLRGQDQLMPAAEKSPKL